MRETNLPSRKRLVLYAEHDVTAISCIISRDFSFLFAAFIPHTGEKYILRLLETFKILFNSGRFMSRVCFLEVVL